MTEKDAGLLLGEESVMTEETARLLDLIARATSPWHTVAAARDLLLRAGFRELFYEEPWGELPSGKYFACAYGSTLFAFTVGAGTPFAITGPLRMAAAHTDAPCFRLKPAAGILREGYGLLNVEPYGGMILRSWLDRPLGLAGKVVLRGRDAFHPDVRLVDFGRPLCVIPSLAIHMDREVNEQGKLNPQEDMLPIAALLGRDFADGDWWREMLAALAGVPAEGILSYELATYPFERGCAVGVAEELLSAPRLDNLTSVSACLAALLRVSARGVPEGVRLVALFDNEEVGSRTKQGAGSALLMGTLKRIYGARARGLAADGPCYASAANDRSHLMAAATAEEQLARAIAAGFLLSVDVAHGLHPDFVSKSDPAVKPILGGGVVLKQAASQSYAGDAEAVAIARALAAERGIPCQDFVNRADSRGGATLGSIASALVPMRTLDVGAPILAMHAARETMAAADETALTRLVEAVLA